jgi:competence protein ComEA
VSSLEFAWGYAEHPALGGTPAVEVSWGLPAFVPEPVESESHATDEAEGGGPDGAATAGPININTAGLEELCSLTGIGPARAEAIIRWREQNGPFGSIDQLADIPGISEALVETLRDDLVTE